MKFNSYKELIVWQKSISLVKEIYRCTKELPNSELYSLASQIQRASISIPANIAEGYNRNHRAEFVQFLSIANGSAGELETHIIISKELYPKINWNNAENLLLEIQKMLSKLKSALKTKR